MRINSNKYKTSFTSTPLHCVNLKKIVTVADNSPILAVFSSLNPKSRGDRNALLQIKDTWRKSQLVRNFCTSFLENQSNLHQFNAIELVNEKPLGERIVGLIKTFPSYNNKEKGLYLATILTKPEFSAHNQGRTIKDIGEIMLGEIFNYAKKTQAHFIEFTSIDDNFYSRVFSKASVHAVEEDASHYCEYLSGEFFIPQGEFDKYLNYCKKQYGLDFSENLKGGIEI